MSWHHISRASLVLFALAGLLQTQSARAGTITGRIQYTNRTHDMSDYAGEQALPPVVKFHRQRSVVGELVGHPQPAHRLQLFLGSQLAPVGPSPQVHQGQAEVEGVPGARQG